MLWSGKRGGANQEDCGRRDVVVKGRQREGETCSQTGGEEGRCIGRREGGRARGRKRKKWR